MPPSSEEIQSVSQLTHAIKNRLTHEFRSLWVAGEVSGVTYARSGHIYLTLRDSGAQISAVVWRSTAERLRFEIENGQEVICRGGIDVFAQRGNYQLNIQQLQPKGMGPLELAFRQLQIKLSREGLFDPEHKRPVPRLPKRIAVVTSPNGAAIRDFLQVINRRWPLVQITIVPARVQGQDSAYEIASGIRVCERMQPRPDVIVVTRGGGSMEDLWSFNEEIVCRAIFDSTIPVVSGVGHEVDVTLSDLVADCRALTPSEAAERLVPDQREVQAFLEGTSKRLRNSLRAKTERAREELMAIASRPSLSRPKERIRSLAMELDHLDRQLKQGFKERLVRSKHELSELAARLESINPLAVLARGYTLTTDSKNRLLTDINRVTPGKTIVTQLVNGSITSQVSEVTESRPSSPKPS